VCRIPLESGYNRHVKELSALSNFQTEVSMVDPVSAYPALSHALQSETSVNSNTPLPLVLFIGSIASFVCGLLNFGQGMTFAVLWNLARFLGFLESSASFSKGIVYGQIFGFCALIPVVIVGWKEVFLLIGYSSIMLAIMNCVRLDLYFNTCC
jgi:hypothetical protein